MKVKQTSLNLPQVPKLLQMKKIGMDLNSGDDRLIRSATAATESDGRNRQGGWPVLLWNVTYNSQARQKLNPYSMWGPQELGVFMGLELGSTTNIL